MKLRNLLVSAALFAGLGLAGSIAESFWQRMAWTTFKETVADTAGTVLADFLKHGLTPEKVTRLEQQVAELQEQLAQRPEDAATAQEAALLRQSLTQTEALLAQMETDRTALEDRVAVLENEFSDLRQTLYAIAPQQVEALPQAALPLAVNYTWRPRGEAGFRPLDNGSVLRSGDLYKIIFTPQTDGYVYIFQTDATGKVYRLFPLDEFGGVRLDHENPVAAGKTYTVPAPGKSFFLDDNTGTEKIYLVATPREDGELEAHYQKLLAARSQGADETAASRALTAQARARGPGGVARDPRKCKARGPGGVAEDCPTQSVRDTDGETKVEQRHLTGACEAAKGCVHVLTFEHR